MTPEERLTQAEKLLETTARYINRHSETLEQHDREMSHLRTTLDRTLEIFGELAAYQRQSQERMERHEQEIRRIWEYLLSQSGNGRSPT
jgi:exonuclease VII small subunit